MTQPIHGRLSLLQHRCAAAPGDHQPAIVLAGDELLKSIDKSLGETLEKQLGITGTYFGPIASRPVIRGLSNQRVQVLEDSIASLDVSALSEDHSVTVDPLVARSIEVIKGPGTLLYGNAAVGGVVNVLTNRIPETRLQEPLDGAIELRGRHRVGLAIRRPAPGRSGGRLRPAC